MNIQIKELPKSEIQLNIELTADEFAAYENDAAKHISEHVEIPGFRKGQAPKAFIMSHVGPDKFFEETLNMAFSRTYAKAVQEKKLAIISRPAVKIVSKSPLSYEARVAVLPEIVLKGYEKIKVPKENVEVADKEIDGVVEEMRKYRATYKDVERPVKKGDRVELNFQGFDEGGAALQKTQSKNHPLFVGEGSLVTGFEDQLVGMKKGEKKKFPVTFPKDYGYEPFRSKTVHFEVELKKSEEVILPELTEEFVTQVMGAKKTLPEFRQALKDDMHKRKTLESRQLRENVLLEKFLKEAKFEVSPLIVEEEIDYMMEDIANELQNRGLKFEDYMEKLKKEKRDLRKESAAEAEKRVRVRLILNHLFKELNIDVSEEEIKKTADKLVAAYPEAEKSKLQQQLDAKTGIYLRIKNNLMLEKLFGKFLE